MTFSSTAVIHHQPARYQPPSRRGETFLVRKRTTLMEHGETEMGAGILLKISREFGKSIEWLLTGEEQK